MAEIANILKDNDFEVEVLSTALPNNPSRADIDEALIENGYTLPLLNKVSFHLFDGSLMFTVTWFPLIPNGGSVGKYGYEKLTLKG